MWRVCFLIALACLLTGCTSLDDFRPYIPPPEIHDPAALARDEKTCLGYAKAYRPGLDAGAITSNAVQDAADNTAGAAISPLVPLAAGVGGAGSELLRQLGLLGSAKRRVYLLCLHDKGQASGAYHVYDPRLF